MIVFTCTSCSKQLKVKDELAGKKGKCPSCGTLTTVPGDRTITVHSEKSHRSSGPAANPTMAPRLIETGVANETQGSVSGSRARNAGDNETIDAQQKPGDDSEDLTAFLAPPQAPDEIGRLGGYRVLAVLGQGGMGVVFRAEDPSLKRHVALKAMLPQVAKRVENRERFLREAQAAAAVRNDHVVSIFQVGEDRDVPFLAMEFLEGEPLDVRLKQEPSLGMDEVIRLGREAALGLSTAHARGLVHRDIKPSNLWLEGERRRLKILDFGLARLAEDTHLTKSGAIVGTPAYMAPEQASGAKVDHRCDLFSLGCVLYRMATGEMPFKGGDTMSILMALATETPPAAVEVNPAVPLELSDLIAELMEKKPADRPTSAKEVAERLEEIESSIDVPAKSKRPKPARKSNVSSFKAKPAKSSRRLVWSIAAGVVGLAAAVAGIVLLWQTPDGAVRLESDDPDVQIVFDKTGPTIKGIDKEPIALRPGEYGVIVKRGDFESLTDKLVIKRGETVSLRVTFLGNRLQVFRDGAPFGEKELGAVAKLPNPKSGDQDPPAKKSSGKANESPLPEAKSANKNFLRVVDQDAGPATALAFNKAGRRLLSAHGSALRLWDVDSGKLVGKWEDKTFGNIEQVAFSPDDSAIASGSEIGVKLHHPRTLEARETSIAGNVSTLAFSPDGAHLVAGVSLPGEVGGLRAILAKSGADLGPFTYSLPKAANELAIRPHQTRIVVLTFVTFLEGGEGLVSIDEAGGVHGWSLNPQPQQIRVSQTFTGFGESSGWSAFAADNTENRGFGIRRAMAIAGLNTQRRAISVKYAFSGGTYGPVGPGAKIWSMNSFPGSFDTGSPVRRIAFASGGTFLLGAMDDGSLSVWEHLTFDPIVNVPLDPEKQPLRLMAVSNDGRTVAVSVGAGIEIAAVRKIVPPPENTPERAAALEILTATGPDAPELVAHRRAGSQGFRAPISSAEDVPARMPIFGVVWRMKPSEEHLALIQTFKELEVLGINTANSVAAFDVTDKHLKWIENLPKLKSLNIGGARLPPGGFKRLKNLDSLNMPNARLTEPDLTDLAAASPQLTHLNLMTATVTNEMLPALKAFPKLERVVLEDTQVTEEGIKSTLSQLPGNISFQFKNKVYRRDKK